MNEKVWIALSEYLVKGANPYGKSYSMDVMDLKGDNANKEAFFQYPPFILIAYAPTLLWPFPQRFGPVDFMPAFYVINGLAGFFIFYRLFREGYKYSAVIFWIVAAPVLSLFDFATFISFPLLFLVLAFFNRENPIRCGLCIGLGVASYTYLGVPALFLLLYNLKSGNLKRFRDFIIGILPAAIVVLIFLIWNPLAFLHDIFISQATNKPANFLYPYYSIPGGPSYWWMHIFSLPPYINTIYNLIVDPAQKHNAPYLTVSLTILAVLFIFFLLYRFYRYPDKTKMILYSFFALLSITLVSAKGFPHYLIYPLILLVFILDPRRKVPVRKHVPLKIVLRLTFRHSFIRIREFAVKIFHLPKEN